VHVDPDRADELTDLAAERRAAADGEAQSTAESAAGLAEDEGVGARQREPLAE